MLDLNWQEKGHAPSIDELERLHRGKTGALFSASCELGAIAAGAEKHREAMANYGMALGVAFQHADDLDDGDFPENLEEAQRRRKQLAAQAEDSLAPLGNSAAELRDIVQWIGSA